MTLPLDEKELELDEKELEDFLEALEAWEIQPDEDWVEIPQSLYEQADSCLEPRFELGSLLGALYDWYFRGKEPDRLSEKAQALFEEHRYDLPCSDGCYVKKLLAGEGKHSEDPHVNKED